MSFLADVQKIGMSVPASIAWVMSASSSATVTRPRVRYFSISASSASTTASMSCERAAATIDRAASGMSVGGSSRQMTPS